MLSLKNSLKSKLKTAERIAFVGVGSDLRADDAAGVLVAESLKTFKPRKGLKLKVFIGATAPENFTGGIKQFNPTHIVIIDSADFSRQPGKVKLIRQQDLGGTSFCTHRLPLKVMIDYLIQALDCRVVIIGIQPKDVTFGKPLTKQIEEAVKQVSSAIKEILK